MRAERINITCLKCRVRTLEKTRYEYRIVLNIYVGASALINRSPWYCIREGRDLEVPAYDSFRVRYLKGGDLAYEILPRIENSTQAEPVLLPGGFWRRFSSGPSLSKTLMYTNVNLQKCLYVPQSTGRMEHVS